MFKIAICDDVPVVCDEIKRIILDNKKYLSGESIEVYVFYSGEALINELREKNKFDLIFLDIELGHINGVEVGHLIREELEDYITKIIYISSRDTYDRQLFDVQPFHFLQKPIEPKKVLKDIKLAIRLLKRENCAFEFKISRETIKIPYKDIMYFESRYREIISIGTQDEYTFYDNLRNVLSALPDSFIYPHRSYIVNYEFVKRFRYEELILMNGTTIPISRGKRKEIRDLQVLLGRKGENSESY